MKRAIFGLAAVVLLAGGVGQADAAMTSAHLTLDSSPGSFIGGGGSFDVTYTPDNTAPNFFQANILSFDNVNGQPAFLRFVFLQPGNPDNFAILDFATNQLGIPIAVGTYDMVERASFASPGFAGLDVSFDHRGANTVSGSFTVEDVSFFQDASGNLQIGHFAASFEESADNNTSHFTGTFEYTDGNAPVTTPEPSTLTLLGLGTLGLLGYGWRRRKLSAG